MAAQRGRLLTLFAIAFAILAVSNLLKPLRLEDSTTGFVFFGHRLSGTANLVIGPLFGLLLGVYGWGVWRMRTFALPLAYAYAAYIVTNLVAYARQESVSEGPGGLVGYLLYAGIAVGASMTCAVVLTRRARELT